MSRGGEILFRYLFESLEEIVQGLASGPMTKPPPQRPRTPKISPEEIARKKAEHEAILARYAARDGTHAEERRASKAAWDREDRVNRALASLSGDEHKSRRWFDLTHLFYPPRGTGMHFRQTAQWVATNYSRSSADYVDERSGTSITYTSRGGPESATALTVVNADRTSKRIEIHRTRFAPKEGTFIILGGASAATLTEAELSAVSALLNSDVGPMHPASERPFVLARRHPRFAGEGGKRHYDEDLVAFVEQGSEPDLS